MPIVGLQRGIPYAGDLPGPFSQRSDARALRIIMEPRVNGEVRRRSVNQSDDRIGCLDYLWSLRFREDVEVWWLARHDLPPGPGMLYVEPGESDSSLVTLLHENGSRTSVVDGLRDWIASASDLGVAEGDVSLARAAEALGADIVVTQRDALLNADAAGLRVANPLGPIEAVGIAALCLRLRGDFPVWAEKGYSVNTTSRTAARCALWALMPSLSAWQAGLGTYASRTGERSLSMLGQAFMERLVRALVHRDQIHRILLDVHSGSSSTVLAEHFDYMMLNLMSALDVSARVAHMTSGLEPSSRYSASWGDPRWVRRIGQNNRQLARVLKPADGASASILTMISRLRNSVHGEMLSPVVVRGGQPGILLTVPDQDGQDLLQLVERTGSAAEWGLALGHGEVLLDPGRFSEMICPHLFQILEQLLALSAVAADGAHWEAVERGLKLARLEPGWARVLMGLSEDLHEGDVASRPFVR